MYSFDVSEDEATATYREVCGAYENIFTRLGLPVVKGENLHTYMYTEM